MAWVEKTLEQGSASDAELGWAGRKPGMFILKWAWGASHLSSLKWSALRTLPSSPRPLFSKPSTPADCAGLAPWGRP